MRSRSLRYTGKRVHSETDIDDAGSSMVSFAFDQAMMAMGAVDLKGKTALVLGAGAMSSLAATQAGRLGIDKLIIANRTFDRAERLAGHAHEAGVHAEAIEFHRRTAVLDDVDVVISATGAQEFTLTKQDIPAGHNLMIIDLSLPRDIDNAVAELDNVTLINIERLSDSLDAADTEVAGGADPQVAARAIVREELEAYSLHSAYARLFQRLQLAPPRG